MPYTYVGILLGRYISIGSEMRDRNKQMKIQLPNMYLEVCKELEVYFFSKKLFIHGQRK